jgi:hypothetical protein
MRSARKEETVLPMAASDIVVEENVIEAVE